MVVRLNKSVWKGRGNAAFKIMEYICSRSGLLHYSMCSNYIPDTSLQAPNSSVLAPDAGISDLAIVIFLSLSMAVTRVALVHFLVPNYKQPKRLEALVRCKSIHLLSSSYSRSRMVTPTKSLRLKNFNTTDFRNLAGLPIPDLSNKEDIRSEEEEDDDNESIKIDIRPKFPARDLEQRAEDKQDDWSFHHGDFDEDEGEEHQLPAPAVSSGLLTNTSAQNLQALLEQAAPQAASTNVLPRNKTSTTKISEDRIFAAPKYATAVFRLIFCSVSCTIALCFFWAADFWPPAVGGYGNTSNCWDLSSIGVTLMHKDFDKIVDSDFDSYNPVLRRYYLIQASYHFHSAAFHILTSMLLWFVSKSSSKKKEASGPRFFGFIPMSMFTLYNVRIFLQHIFSLVLILGTYLFSSTRRLGAIAMFSFDASSLFLHLLQMGINAPKNKRIQTSSIMVLHRYLVIPAFCYARFYVFPLIVGYSAMEESQDWLQQLENLLVPGTAKFIHGFFVIAFLLFMLMNLVYFWRLLKHPHIVYAQQKVATAPVSKQEQHE